MCTNKGKTMYMIFFEGKIQKYQAITADSQTIERRNILLPRDCFQI